MRRQRTFAYALILLSYFAPPAKAQTPTATVSKIPHQCVFGIFYTVSSSYTDMPESSVGILRAMISEFDKGGELLGAVCNNSQYLKLPPKARQLFDQQVQSIASCKDLMYAKSQQIDLDYVLRIAQRENALLQSLVDLLKYGEIREKVADSVKEGAKRALAVVNTSAGFQGKIGKVFEAAEGALTATKLAGEVASDTVIDGFKDRLYDAVSEQIGNATKLLADDAFKNRMDSISKMATCQ